MSHYQDVLQSSSTPEMMASVLGPLMVSVLTNIHIVDHNTPASLVPRIQDLMRNTMKNLQELQDKFCSLAVTKASFFDLLLVKVSCALREFAEVSKSDGNAAKS